MKWIAWHKASSTLERPLCWWVLSELYVNRCYSCRGTINSVVIIIDFPQVIIISHILDIQGFNAALQMAFWLIGTMLQGSTNTEAILIRSVALLLCQDYSSLWPMHKWFRYTAGVNQLIAVAWTCKLFTRAEEQNSWWLRLLPVSLQSIDKSCNRSINTNSLTYSQS